ncbi:MAG: hypothetical protein O9302_01315 [Cyclobacteriaceae bacterium]|jgi:hypothetical protein|nr:hypothetical protein [Cytophagales bacterium]MCZ8326670.1 hypothetical protein [Cyclobacteriaceae bacterium]
MSSTTETGHAKNVATFEDLISFCTGYGATYNPSRAALKLPALNTQNTAANAAMQAVKVAKTNYDNATNAREITFKQLKSLSTKIINALASTEATEQTIDDAKTTNNKIQGKRAKAKDKPDANAADPNAPTPKTISASQQSYDKLIDHFAQLVATLTAEPKYTPNENELKVTSLNTLLTDLKAKNTAVINATTALSNARIARDKALYDETTGLLAIAQDVKQYVKSLYGASSPQYKQVTALKFTKRQTQ